MSKSYICPQCDQTIQGPLPQEKSTFPFCSERCRLLDLGAWASGKYVISGKAPSEEEDASSLDQNEHLGAKTTKE